jgi:ribose/xylose/arabinose/galactoside ABC-type transport system permease subunit
MPIVLLAAAFVVGQAVLGSTGFGRRLMTVGVDEHSARLTGLRVE